jgi:hypothetical protein
MLARILLSLATIVYAFVTIKADFNATHATNPTWTPHARFHVVWQVLSYSGIGLVSLGLIWIRGPMEVERLYVAALLGAVIYAAFYIALFSRSLFGGRLYDENGYPPFKPPFGPTQLRWDINVTAFTAASIVLLLGVIAI